MKTKIKFLYHKKNNDLFAFCPFESVDLNGNLWAYSHIGQHSACAPAYAKESRPATVKEYIPLLKELTNLGYDIEIIK